jgi:hypothetical protein
MAKRAPEIGIGIARFTIWDACDDDRIASHVMAVSAISSGTSSGTLRCRTSRR